MTARDLLVLLDRPCAIRHPDGTLSPGILSDAFLPYGELRCAVRVEGLTDAGHRKTWEQTYPGSRVWLLERERWTRADEIVGRAARETGGAA